VPRHQTLRTAVEWSYGLCTPPEQALWARLSVFAGAFDLAAAEEVCSGDGVPRDEVVHTLISLVEKSVVLRDGPGGTRYRLLDTLREFGAQRLAEAGQEAEYRRRHVRRYLAMARYVRDHPLDDDQVTRFRELSGERANLRAALEYALDSGVPSLRGKGAELAAALDGYWVASGLLAEGRYWLAKSLDQAPRDCIERAWALIVRGYLAAFAGDVRDAVDDAREGIRIAGTLGPAGTGIEARGHLYLNIALTFGGWHEEAAIAGAEAERHLAAQDDKTGLLLLDTQMAHLYQLTGQLDLAVSRCQQALRHFGASQERWLHGYLYTIAAAAYFQQPGKERECAAAAVKGLRAKYELGDTIGIAYALEVLAWLAVGAERFERAAWLMGAADPLWDRAGKRLSGTEILEEFHKQAEKAACGKLGKKPFATLRTQGATRRLGDVVAAAAGDLDELPPSQAALGEGGIPVSPGNPADAGSGADAATAGTDGAAVSAEQSGLTAREHQIAALVANGLSNREIAAKLVISKRTVDAHVEHIFAKLGISSRVQLTVLLRQWLPRARDAADDHIGKHVG
jgi:non-specific serine/threonine protein kinase